MRVLHIEYHFGLLHRNNPLWGTKAVKRLRKHQRSMSDPDMNQVAMLSTIPSYLIAYSDRGSTPNMEKSESGKYGTESLDASSNHLKTTGMGRSVSSPHCIREAKDQHIRTFLETMAYEEEDLGIMENTASNSTSEFSSPLSLTPPDVEGVLSSIMRGSEAKCSRKEGGVELVKGRKEEGRKATQDAEGSDKRDEPEEGAILMSAVGRRRNSDLPEFSPKIYSKPEDAFLAGKRASVAEVHIFVQAADSDEGVSAERSLAGVDKIVEHASSMEDVEEDGEMVEDRAVKSPRLSQSHSFPEELNTMESQEEETNDMHLAARQHRRSRSELQMNEVSTEMDSKEEISIPITAPQIESVRERVKEMEKQAVSAGSSTLLEPAVNNWYKRVYSAPSLHSASSGMCLTPPHELAVSVSRPSSRASNWEEIAEETEEETVTFTASGEAGTSLPASPPCERTMDCGQTEEKQQEGEIDGASAVSHGQVTEQVSVEEKRPLYRGLCWEPVHSRSQSNVESSSVKAMIETLEKRTQPLHASMQSLVRSDESQKSGGEGEEGVLQGKVEEEDDKLVVEGVGGSGSGRVVEKTQQEGCVVKRTQSLGALHHGSDQGPPLHSSHAAVKKHDSYPFSMAHGEPWLIIPEIETTDGISTDVASQSKDSDKSNLVEMESLSASVLELTQKFEERKPKPPPQIKHSFSSSSGAPHKVSTSRPVSSDEERGKSASPGPASLDPPSLNM